MEHASRMNIITSKPSDRISVETLLRSDNDEEQGIERTQARKLKVPMPSTGRLQGDGCQLSSNYSPLAPPAPIPPLALVSPKTASSQIYDHASPRSHDKTITPPLMGREISPCLTASNTLDDQIFPQIQLPSQNTTYTSARPPHSPFPITVYHSRDSSNKRQKQAIASRKFRTRRKERQLAATQEIMDLKQLLKVVCEDRDFYKKERDVLAPALYKSDGGKKFFPRPASPRRRRGDFQRSGPSLPLVQDSAQRVDIHAQDDQETALLHAHQAPHSC
ncbi:MAG: hypothetical protein Q9162_002349 [Coniocarpon cinnabarinum]